MVRGVRKERKREKNMKKRKNKRGGPPAIPALSPFMQTTSIAHHSCLEAGSLLRGLGSNQFLTLETTFSLERSPQNLRMVGQTLLHTLTLKPRRSLYTTIRPSDLQYFF